MTTQSYQQKVTDSKPDLFHIHDNFGEQGKRLSDIFIRLTSIGNRLSEDMEMDKANGSVPQPERMPGIISHLYSDIDGFRSLNNNLEAIVTKLEKFI